MLQDINLSQQEAKHRNGIDILSSLILKHNGIESNVLHATPKDSSSEDGELFPFTEFEKSSRLVGEYCRPSRGHDFLLSDDCLVSFGCCRIYWKIFYPVFRNRSRVFEKDRRGKGLQGVLEQCISHGYGARVLHLRWVLWEKGSRKGALGNLWWTHCP